MSTDPTVKELLQRNKFSRPTFASLPWTPADKLTKKTRRQSLTSTLHLGAIIRRVDTTTHRHSCVCPAASTLRLTVDISVVTCADPRCIPEQFLELRPVEAVIIRNMCGHAAPALNDILALDHLIGFTEIMVIHHTDCGALAFTDDQVRATLRKRRPDDEEIESMSFGTIKDLEQSVRDDLAVIKGSPLMRKELAERSYGFIYDIKTGLVSALED
ncbi:MAG: hypothetical protein ALECFALPRED_002299 [Alectoria fallacina]|uniref:Carbonic anhydrase n=1 Tax=Alectoria fallacina TaxID=1903189 RepID=A0A8H3FG73_9LECA|nr:MAG: hypothetical protein ALECFALPRED_002299 [Alectoria fallacina]